MPDLRSDDSNDRDQCVLKRVLTDDNLFGDALRAIGDSAAMGAVDACIAWGLLIAGVLLMLGRLVRPAAIFGVIYFVLMYLLNPPHFGHTGESHFMYIDRNVIEMVMLFCVMFCTCRHVEESSGGKEGHKT